MTHRVNGVFKGGGAKGIYYVGVNYVNSWAPYGGVQPFIDLTDWSVLNDVG